MTAEQFVQAAKIQTSDAAINGTIALLKRPPGRKPREDDVRLSQWYRQLSTQDQEMLHRALREAAELAIFEFFCILDGVTAIEDSWEKGTLSLNFVKGPETVQLNDPDRMELHNIFNRLCDGNITPFKPNPDLTAGDSGEVTQLKARLMPGDDLDIHHVPDKHLAPTMLEGYRSESAPVIALRKVEHRKLGSM